MKNLCLTFLALTALLFSSCNSDEDVIEVEPVIANFEIVESIEQNMVVLTMHNTSVGAENYEWFFTEGSPDYSVEENPTTSYLLNGDYTIVLIASNGTQTDTLSVEYSVSSIEEQAYTTYRYLENDGIFMYYETENEQVYQSLIPDTFNMPSRMLVYAFIIDFYELDYGATPYKENSIFILVEYQGEEFWHCVYMPVTDVYSMWAGIIGLGLPKTMGEINFTRDEPLYYGDGTNVFGATMNMSVNTENYVIDESDKQEMIDLSLLRSLNIRNGEIIEMGHTGGQNSAIEIAEQYPNLRTIEFGEGYVTTNTDAIIINHPLDLTPSNMIGAYYLKNTIPFSLTGNPF